MRADHIRARLSRSPFGVLWRAFFAQFLVSESATSDAQHRQTMIVALTFLLPPGMFAMLAVFPEYERIVMFFPELIDQARMRLALVLVTYAMVTIGFIAVFVWEGLTFDRRDAMVIGPLPLRNGTIIGAKLAALVTLLLGAALAVNLTTALPFALVTANHLGFVSFARDVSSHLVATIGAATFVFSSLVVARALVVLLGSARMAARLGSLLQFLFVLGTLCFVLLLPALLRIRRADFLATASTTINPAAWFLGLFEYLHGSPDPAFAMLTRRALLALALAVIGGVLLSIVSVQRQMQRALAPVASAGALGRAHVSRTVARWLLRRDPVARATADFILLTIARNRAQQAPIAIVSAIGIAIVLANLSSFGRVHELRGMMRPTVDVLWIPLVLAFWMAIGVRASFFVPSELPAAWSFRAHAPETARSYWSATRAAMMAFVLPPMLAISGLLAAVIGWRAAAWHALFVTSMTMLLVQVLTLGLAHIPFTHAYEPGHAKLRSRWPLYLIGMYVFAYWPVRGELLLLTNPTPSPTAILTLAASVAAAMILLEVIGRRRARNWSIEAPEQSIDDSIRLSVLDIGQTPARVRLVSNGHATP